MGEPTKLRKLNKLTLTCEGILIVLPYKNVQSTNGFHGGKILREIHRPCFAGRL